MAAPGLSVKRIFLRSQHSRYGFQSRRFSVAKLMRNNDLYDVTLVRRDNQKFEVHKVILTAYINVFKNMLASDKHPHPMICMRVF